MKRLIIRAAPVEQLRDDIMSRGLVHPHLDVDSYPYKSLREIAQKVNELTAESREASLLRRDFFANASHELKTPVTAIKGSAELLCADVPLGEAQQRELLERIGLEAERLSRLINDIIMINRLESDEAVGQKEEVDLEDIVHECMGEVTTLARRNKIRLSVDTQPSLLLVNRKNVYEIIINLIANAVNYTHPDGRVEIKLRSSVERIVFSIRNDSEPIPPGHQARIFERFYRLDSGRSKAAGGTGLGLSIVKHAVESLGGTIRLESNERIGVLFTVTLPKSAER